MKVVINSCYGGFSLSKEAYEFLGLPWDDSGLAFDEDSKRADLKLVECVEKLGNKADGNGAQLKVVEIPDGTDFCIEEYDGREWVAEQHRTWS